MTTKIVKSKLEEDITNNYKIYGNKRVPRYEK